MSIRYDENIDFTQKFDIYKQQKNFLYTFVTNTKKKNNNNDDNSQSFTIKMLFYKVLGGTSSNGLVNRTTIKK